MAETGVSWISFCGRLRRNDSKAVMLALVRKRLEAISELDPAHQVGEHGEGLALVFDHRVFLADGAQVDAVPQRIDGVEMLLPEPVDGAEQRVTARATAARSGPRT
jgi:hypothetical protein